tara:strand:+ start:836 stop:1630 length:795 start_codon:yes stop_codon:yes gene_type:complete
MNNQTTKYKSGYDDNLTYFEYNLDNKSIPSIFIHGVGLDSSMWSNQKKIFNKNCIFYDLINHGKTKKKLIKIKYEDFNLQLKKLIKFFNLKKFNLIGFSLGSTIALNFATRNIKNINKIIILSAIYNRSDKEKKMVLSRYKLALQGKSISDLAIKRWFTKDYIIKKPFVYKKFFKLLENNKSENFLPAYKLFANSNKLKFDFNKFSIPTLIITGEKDINSTTEMSRKLSKKIKKSKLNIIAKAKHMAVYEKANLINAKIKKFLE